MAICSSYSVLRFSHCMQVDVAARAADSKLPPSASSNAVAATQFSVQQRPDSEEALAGMLGAHSPEPAIHYEGEANSADREA